MHVNDQAITAGLQPGTVAVLRRFAEYVSEIDGVDASLDQLADSLITAYLSEEHAQFQEWLSNPDLVANKRGWKACAAKNRGLKSHA